MDIVQARTFLAVLETGTFLAAAEKVNVAQSTVSTRIKALEDQLGQELFVRNKAGASPTRVGLSFARHAQAIVRMWDQARLSLALPAGHRRMLAIGAQPSLWDGFLLNWLPWMHSHMPDIAIRAQMLASSHLLMQQLTEGTLDLIVLYRPEARAGFTIRQLFEEQLVLVTSIPGQRIFSEDDYVYLDWGPEFEADHALNFPDMATPNLHLNVGSLGISFLETTHASGYFPLRIAAPYIKKGILTLVDDAPIFTYPTYAAYSDDLDVTLRQTIFRGLKHVAKQDEVGAPTPKALRKPGR